jgi:hypothetical protein
MKRVVLVWCNAQYQKRDAKWGSPLTLVLKRRVSPVCTMILCSASLRTSVQEVALVGVSAATVFLLLDLFAPSVGSATRSGAGLGIGLNRVGFEAFDNNNNKKKKKVNSGHLRGTAPKEEFRPKQQVCVSRDLAQQQVACICLLLRF